MTDLANRIDLFTKGQLTWPEPELKARCQGCAQFSLTGDKNKAIGRCVKVKAMHGVDGFAFDGEAAIACPQFEAK